MARWINAHMPYVFPVAIVLLGIIYGNVNPEEANHPLQCPWHLLTGTQCPACGMQRALHAVMHGSFGQAMRYNYFFALSIPYALLAILCSWYNVNHVFDKLKLIVFHRYTLRLYVVLYVSWWILRNILGL